MAAVLAAAQQPDSASNRQGSVATSTHPGTDKRDGTSASSQPSNWFAQERTTLGNVVSDQKAFWTRPFKMATDDIHWAFPVATASSLLIGSDTSMEKTLPGSTTLIQRSQKFSSVGTASIVGTAGALYLWGTTRHNDHARETGVLSAEALANGLLTSELMKTAFARERPSEGNGHGRFWQGGGSFPSNHAVAAWSVASVITHEYPGPLTKLLAYGAASAVSVSRVTGRQHFASDVVIGSALGWYFGRQIYRTRHNPELGGASLDASDGFAAESEAESSRSLANRGSPTAPLDSWIYPALERLAALGYVQTAFLGQRPWTRMECARLLNEAAEHIEEGGLADSQVHQLYTALVNEFSGEIDDSPSSRTLGIDAVYTRATGISGTPLRDGFHFGQTIINDLGRPYGEGFNAVGGITAHGTAGPFSFDFQGEYQHAPAVISDPISVQEATANVDATQSLPNGKEQINRFRLLNGTVGLTLHNLRFSFGQQNLWLGPSESGPLLFSNNADSMMMLRVEPATPYSVPLLSKLLGPVRSEFFLARLSGHHWEYSPVLYGPELRSQPFIHGSKIGFRPTKNLEIGLGFTAQFGGDGNPFTWSNFFRTFYSHKVGVGRNPAKRLSQFDFVYRVPGLRNWLQVYADSMVIDEYSPLISNRPAINPGIYLPRLPKLHNLDLRLEGVTTDLNVPDHFGPGAFYWDGRYRSGYTNGGNLIGSWIGRRGRAEQAWLTYRFSPHSNLQFRYRHNSVDKSFLRGGNLQDVALSGEWKLASAIGISGSVQHEDWRFAALSPVRHSNVAVSFQMTYWPTHARK